MAFGEVNVFYPSAYTDVITEAIALLVANGWTQVGATDIYKSPVADANGYYSYVRIYDSGGFLTCQSGVRLNQAETAMIDSRARSTTFNNTYGIWVMIVYPLWFYCYGMEDRTQPRRDCIGGGLFRAIPGSWGVDIPYWVAAAGTSGVDETGFNTALNGPGYGIQSRRPNNDRLYHSRSRLPLVRTASAYTFTSEEGQNAGGALITDMWISGAEDAYCMLGTHYNVKVFHGWYYTSTTSELRAGSGQWIEIGGVPYRTIPGTRLWADIAAVILFEAPESDNFA